MPDVRMPDGTIIRNVPEGTTQEELMRRLGRRDEPPAEEAQEAFDPGFFRTARNSMLNMILRNATGAPALAAEAVTNLPSQMVSNLSFGAVPAQPPMGIGEVAPAVRGATPTPTDLRAAVETIPGVAQDVAQDQVPDVAGEFREQREGLERTFRAGEEQHPLADILGQAAGEGVSLALMRTPLAKGLTRLRGTKPPPGVPRDVFDRVLNFGKDIARSLSRGGVKVGEASLEGAVLGSLKDEDPRTRIAAAAGAQAAGSLGLYMATHPVKALLPTVATATVAHQILQAVGPGERNIFEALDFGIDKVIIAFAAGAAGSLTGMGRVTGRAGQKVPEMLDALTAVPRGATQSLIMEALGDPTVERVVEEMSTNPDFFSPEARRRLGRAMQDGRRSVRRTIDELSKGRAFREQLEELDAQ